MTCEDCHHLASSFPGWWSYHNQQGEVSLQVQLHGQVHGQECVQGEELGQGGGEQAGWENDAWYGFSMTLLAELQGSVNCQ